MRGSNCLICRRPHPDRVLFHSRKHLGRAHVRSKIALPLKTCFKDGRLLSIKKKAFASKVLLLGEVKPNRPRSFSFKNRALVRDILKKSTSVYRLSIEKKQALAFKVLGEGGSNIELATFRFLEKSRSRARHAQNFAFFGLYKILKVGLCARHLDFFDVWMMFVFFLSSSKLIKITPESFDHS